MKNSKMMLMCIVCLLFVSCGSGEESAGNEENATKEISVDTEKELEEARGLQEEAIVLDAEVDEFIQTL